MPTYDFYFKGSCGTPLFYIGNFPVYSVSFIDYVLRVLRQAGFRDYHYCLLACRPLGNYLILFFVSKRVNNGNLETQSFSLKFSFSAFLNSQFEPLVERSSYFIIVLLFHLHFSHSWRYQTALSLQGTSFFGKMATYKGGGYAVELSKKKDESLKIIQSLKVC